MQQMAGFQIPRVVPTVCKSIRFPQDVALAVEKVIEGRPCTFSATEINYARRLDDSYTEGP